MIGMHLKYIGSDDNQFGLHYGDVVRVDFRPSAYGGGIMADWYSKERQRDYWKIYSSLKAFTQEWTDNEPIKRHGKGK